MQDAEKVEIGYTLPKERWQEAAKNLEDLGNALAASLRAHNKDGRGAEDADELMVVGEDPGRRKNVGNPKDTPAK